MENLNDNTVDAEDDLRASNELMRLKLELDHHMIMSGSTSELPPEVENQWLNNIYNFEKQFKEAGRSKVYDLLDRPAFAKYDALTEDQFHQERQRLESLMEEKNFVLDCCCDYEDKVIYRFITEELFEHETDAFLMEGMVHHFIYEEFHPNHDYDLRRHTTDFLERIMERKWNDTYYQFFLSEIVSFQGKEFPASMVSSIMIAFQEAHSFFDCKKTQIENVHFDLGTGKGMVEVYVEYIAHPIHGMAKVFEGKGQIHFINEYDCWTISGFEFHGFSNTEIH